MNFKDLLRLNEDVVMQKKIEDLGKNKQDGEKQNFDDYIKTDIENKIKNGADFSKVKDWKKFSSNMKTIADAKGMDNAPKDEKDAEDRIQSEVLKQMTNEGGENTNPDATVQAEKEIDEITKQIQESWIPELHKSLREEILKKKLISAACVFIDLDSLKMLGAHSTQEWARKSHQDKGPWGLPKGQIDEGENSTEAVIREIKEEMDYDIDASKLHHIGIVKYLPVKDLDIFVYPVSGEELENLAQTSKCVSYFENKAGAQQPEIDDFKVCALEELGKSYQMSIKSALSDIFSDCK